MERARREFEALQGIQNPHVVDVVSDYVELGDPPVAVAWAVEFVSGHSVAELFDHRWAWDEACQLAVDVATGLKAFHARNIVHRDLSPANVMKCSDDGRYVVLDPGYARFVDYTTITHLAHPGTLGYHSPEHFDGGDGPVARSDIYTLGVLLFQALTGELPIPVQSKQDYAKRLLAPGRPSVAEHRDDLTGDQVEFVDTCLRRQPARRFRHCDHLLDYASEL